MKLPIYLDYSATTPVDPRVAEKMMQFLTMDGTFGNPASRSHRFGWQAESSLPLVRLNPTTWRSRVQPTFIRKRASTSSPAKPSIKRFWIPAVSWSAKASK